MSLAEHADFDSWREQLIRLGGSIHQDEAPPLDDEADEDQQAGIQRYLEMLDELEENAGDLTGPQVEAVLLSLHALDDYGIYETAYGVLSQVDPEVLGKATAHVLPGWIAERGDHDAIASAASRVAYSEDATRHFLGTAQSWSDPQRSTVLPALSRWFREDAAWERIHSALGGTAQPAAVDPIPADWPADWITAAEAFRSSGSVTGAWLDEGDFESNFPRVLALLELEHGQRWREVPDLLNPLFVRRRNMLPAFGAALAALPAPRRERILAAIERARADTANALRELITQSE
ncbi:hypothetical protein [Microbacterium sp. ZW T5_56]|uniref:hypothetical protein n=1 Tax=Microbacterium sp. ZW T5_56 TaxID=3378081 RepID=UPI003854E557